LGTREVAEQLIPEKPIMKEQMGLGQGVNRSFIVKNGKRLFFYVVLLNNFI
jgi:hypothetical protein